MGTQTVQMGIKKVDITRDLPLEEGRTYLTKRQTKDTFTVTRINVDKNGKRDRNIMGIDNSCPGLGVIRIDEDRLVHDKEFVRTQELCDCCSFPVDEKFKEKEDRLMNS